MAKEYIGGVDVEVLLVLDDKRVDNVVVEAPLALVDFEGGPGQSTIFRSDEMIVASDWTRPLQHYPQALR